MQPPLDDSGEPARKGEVVKPLRTRLQEMRGRLGTSWEVLERDYLLSWVLAGVARVAPLRDTLVFKGGTALKKCYFGDYRFSEDLDFSGLEGVPSGDAMELAVREACDVAAKLLDPYAPVDIRCERYTEKDPHPGDQGAFTIRARLPWHRRPQTRVLIEISVDEMILRPPQTRKILHEYGEPLEAQVRVYALEEIIAEKLRAILQHVEKLEERGWSRSRARDYYDLWHVLASYKNLFELRGFDTLLREKCAVRRVAFNRAEDFFDDRLLAYVQKTWTQWLGPLVPGLPTFETVIGELRPQVTALISPGA
jgi:predicted nucleotidyltransferase component of viral defense system